MTGIYCRLLAARRLTFLALSKPQRNGMTKWCKQRPRAVSVRAARFKWWKENTFVPFMFSLPRATLGWRALKKQKFKSANTTERPNGGDEEIARVKSILRRRKKRAYIFPRRREQARKNLLRLERYASSQSYKPIPFIFAELWHCCEKFISAG